MRPSRKGKPVDVPAAAPRKKQRRVTAAQVAEAAGVAQTTVSAILNNRKHCYASKATRQLVWDAARQLGYRPNLAARSLLGMRTQTIGVVASGHSMEHLATILGHLEVQANSRGYVAITVTHRNKPEMEERAIVHLRDRFVDGLVVYPASTGEHRELVRLADDGVPVVTINGGDGLAGRISDVSQDNVEGGRIQAQHMIDRGCRSLGVISNNAQAASVTDRIKGIKEMVRQADGVKLALMMLDIPHDANQHAGRMGYPQIFELLKSHHDTFDGIIATNDSLALATARALHRLGVAVPADCAVMGFDNDAFGEICPVALSSVTPQKERAGEQALELLLARIEGRTPLSQVERKWLSPVLVARESTATTQAGAAQHVVDST